MSGQPFSEIMQEFLRSVKVIAVCEASVKNRSMGSCWLMITREKKELMNHKCMRRIGVTMSQKQQWQ